MFYFCCILLRSITSEQQFVITILNVPCKQMGHAAAYLVEALCYTPEGRAASWPRDRLSLQQIWVPGIFLGVESGRRVGLTTLPLSVSRMSENVGASTSRNRKALHDMYRDNFTLPYKQI
jgi:hypothetical protein